MALDSETSKNPWTRHSEEEVYSNPWISVFHDEITNPNGGRGIYGRIHFKNFAIGVVPIDEDGNTWLVGQHRYPLDYYSWEIPEGGGNLNIDPLESAKRELQEEVGLEAKKWTLMFKSETSNSATDERALLYLAEDLTPTPTSPDETEDLKLRKLPLKEAIAMVDKGEITDSLSVMALLWLDRHYIRNGE